MGPPVKKSSSSSPLPVLKIDASGQTESEIPVGSQPVKKKSSSSPPPVLKGRCQWAGRIRDTGGDP